ncbi:hypothetical protein DH2020_043351 [Rehmannia glutinosa]|uniref:ENTH domain-containing protein n=1 Tax=Rehmannia glutinosa TaxID=99300 RepID=A0ABR0UJU3_REHGL
MKKAFGQTVRDLKREVNKKVLKVPSIEQKVLDATSNEPWGPHGSLLADIAQATRNYHEYQMIMSVIWKRTNDTGKNWRHVYKALTVLEYLVAHGSERVIDDIREHAYQISTLSDFQYIDSSGKDQGNNVRKKSQSLVVLVNDKERIQEVRQKAAANREKYRSTPVGGMYRPGSLSSSGGYGDKYDDDRYGNRDDDRNGYGEKENGVPEMMIDMVGLENHMAVRGTGIVEIMRSVMAEMGTGMMTTEEEVKALMIIIMGQEVEVLIGTGVAQMRMMASTLPGYGTSGHRSVLVTVNPQSRVRGSGAKADDHSQDGSSTGKSLDRKHSGQSFGVPPSYEDAVGATRSPSYSERDGESSVAYAPKASSPTGASPSHTTTGAVPTPAPASPPAAVSAPAASAPASAQSTTQHINKEVDGFDEFDPRGSFSATPATLNGTAPAPAPAPAVEMDLLGSLSESFSSNSLALVPAITAEANASSDFNSGPTIVSATPASTINNQPFDDPFGDGPFKAVPTADSPSGGVQQELSTPNQDFDILADILPPSAPSSFANTEVGYPLPTNQSVSHGGFPPQTNQPASQHNSFQAQSGLSAGFPTQLGQPSLQTSYPLQSAESVPQTGFSTQTMALTYPVQAGQASQMGFQSQGGPTQPNPNFYGTYNSQTVSTGTAATYMVPPSSTGPTAQHNFLSQSGSAVPIASQMGPQAPSSTGSSAIVPQSSKDKFETKSTVWADTLSRGLVNLNISGPKTNPLADIGVDFDAINRKEKRMEKPTTAAVTSTITMGKAMGSGSGMGRAGATVLRPPPPNAMMGSGMNMGPSGAGMPMGGYGGVTQPTGRGMGMGMGIGMGMGMNIPGNMGMGMNMGMGQGGMNMQQQQMGIPPGSTMPGGYNHMMGTGNYGQQPYGGGYR